MTRLAIIFSLLFVTPIQAADKIIRCGVEGAVFKYKKGISYDECHSHGLLLYPIRVRLGLSQVNGIRVGYEGLP